MNLPDLDGLEVIKRIRLESKVPIIVLTVRDADDDVVASLDAGADVYVTKPFSQRQMIARVQAVILRATGIAEKMYQVGSLSLYVELNKACWRDEALIHLTPLETRLLRGLMRTPDRVLTLRKSDCSCLGIRGRHERDAQTISIPPAKKNRAPTQSRVH